MCIYCEKQFYAVIWLNNTTYKKFTDFYDKYFEK